MPSTKCTCPRQKFREYSAPARNSNGISEFLAGAVVFISEFLAGAEYLMDVILSTPAKKSHFCFHGTVPPHYDILGCEKIEKLS